MLCKVTNQKQKRLGLNFGRDDISVSCLRQNSDEILHDNKKKSDPNHTRDITLNDVTSVGVHPRDLAPGQHGSEEMSKR